MSWQVLLVLSLQPRAQALGIASRTGSRRWWCLWWPWAPEGAHYLLWDVACPLPRQAALSSCRILFTWGMWLPVRCLVWRSGGWAVPSPAIWSSRCVIQNNKKISLLSFFFPYFYRCNSEWYSVQVDGAVWRWRGETNMPNPNQISGTVNHRLRVQNQGTVHPTVTFIQHQPIDTIIKNPQQKQSILSQVVWHLWTLRHYAEVKSKTLILDEKEKNNAFSFSKYIQC